MAQLWELVLVVVCMITKAHGMPMEDTAKTARDSLLTAEQHNTKIVETQNDSSTHSNPPQAHGLSITEIKQLLSTSSVTYPDNAKIIPFTRSTGQNCDKIQSLPNPLECRYFTFCIHPFHDSHQTLEILNVCDPGYRFDPWQVNCIKGECIDVDIGTPPLNHPPPPSPPLPEIPSWFTNPPAWFEKTPWWFEVPPPWYQTPPAWLKPNVLTEEIQIEAGPGLEIQKPDQIIKNVGVPVQSSPDGKDPSLYYDDKTLRINIPIKIVQQ